MTQEEVAVGCPQIGDIYEFPMPEGARITPRWLVVMTNHYYDDVFLVVPVDTLYDPIMSFDVVVEGSAYADKLVLHCGAGNDLPTKFFRSGRKVGQLETEYIPAVQRQATRLFCAAYCNDDVPEAFGHCRQLAEDMAQAVGIDSQELPQVPTQVLADDDEEANEHYMMLVGAGMVLTDRLFSGEF